MIKELLLFIEEGWIAAVFGLVFLAGILAAVRHDLLYRTVRIYNWDGKRYRFLGRERLRRGRDAYVVTMRSRMGEASRTTRYLLLVSAPFAKRCRYENLLLRAGAAQVWLPIEERMRADVLYAHVPGWRTRYLN
ncbi:MAG: hypothetical protein NC302_04830 [Bacteroidales bacterium]|nr:hypothetical protein [Bacteroidales bacterium]MCM1416099.1 hypothetical protein [bacterium]MCM1422831.1 hypothetical protein [bacterium]